MEKVMNMTYASSLTDLSSLNTSFDRGVLRIAYTGENRNKSSISKQAFENCIKSMYNCPIVCNYDRETDTLGGHDMEVVRGGDGSLRVINSTTPVGVIPESAEYWWDTVTEDDGTVHEYLFAEALLWKRQEAYQKIVKDGITAQSMEITVKDGKKIDGVLHIYDFEFTAFALIGVTPCFESAALEMFSGRDFKQQLSEMMQDLKESYTLVNHSKEVNDIFQSNVSMEGGEKVLHDETEMIAEVEPKEETAEFAEQEEVKPEEIEAEAEVVEAEPEAEKPEEFTLSSNVTEEIQRELSSVTVEREWGLCPRYWYVDCGLDVQEVYCFDTENWLLYGFSYSMDGDSVKIDFDSKKRMKYEIVAFDEGAEQESPVAPAFALMEEKLRESAQWEEKYQTASDTITSMETELGELRQFKADTENAALESAREEVFAQFEDLIGVEAYEQLKDNKASYSDIDELTEKLFAIRGRRGTPAKFSHEEKAPKLPVVVRDEDNKINEPYGGIFARYGIEAE